MSLTSRFVFISGALVLNGLVTPLDAANKPLRFAFQEGDAFVYEVVLRWTEGRTIRELKGEPFFRVHHLRGRDAVMLVMGRLRYQEATKGKALRRVPANDYWMPTTLTVDELGCRISSSTGRGTPNCPFEPGHVIVQLAFPELPHHSKHRLESGNSLELRQFEFDSLRAAAGTRSKGRRSGHAAAVPDGTKVGIEIARAFRTDTGTLTSSTSGNAVYDRRLGMILTNEAFRTKRYRKQSSGLAARVDRVRNAMLTTRLQKQAAKDFAELPTDMMPVHFARERIGIDIPERYSAQKLPAEGTMVGLFDSRFREWYVARYLGVAGRNRVRLRYKGSGEDISAKPSQMARLSAATVATAG